MYIDRLFYKNIGPIDEVKISCRRNDADVPFPLIIVGQNGSGKSILLSNIVDAFYEIADLEYENATQAGEKGGHKYYKTIMPSQIKIGKQYMLSHICFYQEDEQFEYVCKSGEIAFSDCLDGMCSPISTSLDWKDAISYKSVTGNKKFVPEIFGRDIICFFGPNRYMRPCWMGDQYNCTEEANTHFVESKIERHLVNPITATNIIERTQQWLFDVIADSRPDLAKKDDEYFVAFPPVNDLSLLTVSRSNTEKVLSTILGEPVIFRMKNRAAGRSRFLICRPDGSELVPSLDALSTGQLALFNLFTTIIRYADNDDINLSHSLEEIKGIVVIDEIELHLHTQLQRKVLPKLISLFPKIQFIITSHSPLFLLGMKEFFGEEQFDVIEMPMGTQISVEQFAEFEKAYLYMTETSRFQREIAAAINQNREKPLIITEGSTDWKHMKAAYNALCRDRRCSAWLPKLDFCFLEYEPQNCDKRNCLKLEMSGSQLQTMCKQYSLLKQPRKMIFIADRDVSAVTKALDGNNDYKKWSEQVYSFCIPVPTFREETPQICIEHLYTDDEIKQEVTLNDGITRRIFMGNEFNKEGFSVSGNHFYCKNKDCCGEGRIDIIDGSDKKKVLIPWNENDNINYALSKMDFAEYILKGVIPFEHMDFSNFIPIFELIRDILQE